MRDKRSGQKMPIVQREGESTWLGMSTWSREDAYDIPVKKEDEGGKRERMVRKAVGLLHESQQNKGGQTFMKPEGTSWSLQIHLFIYH